MRLPTFARGLGFALILAALVTTPTVPAQAQRRPDSGDGINRWLTVINESSYDVHYIYYSRTDMDVYYQRDLLGANTILRSGYNIRLKFDDGYGNCVYDVIAKGRPGSDIRWTKRIDVCSSNSWTLND